VGEARRRPAVWVAVAAAVLLAGALAARGTVGRGSSVRHGGPLACRGCALIASSIPVEVGQKGTYGINVVRNHGSTPGVLDRVVYRRLTPGLDTLHPLALRIRDYKPGGLAAGLTLGFPPRKAARVARPLLGFVVGPHRSDLDDVELLLGFRPTYKGVFKYDAVDLYYHVGKQRYVATYPAALKVCVPTAAFVGPHARKCDFKLPH
jgi:hypothetical protein